MQKSVFAIVLQSMLTSMLTLTLSACSSSGGDKIAAPPTNGTEVAPFTQALIGAWISDCTADVGGFYKENLTFTNRNSGSRARAYFRDQTCARPNSQVVTPVSFSYAAEATSAATTLITLTLADQSTYQATATVEANDLHLAVNLRGSVHYARLQNLLADTGDNDFDRVAVGRWASDTCYPDNRNASLREVMTISGQGRGSLDYISYSRPDCRGPQSPAPESHPFSYTVQIFSQGAGQVVLDGVLTSVTVKDSQLSLTSANETRTYTKF